MEWPIWIWCRRRSPAYWTADRSADRPIIRPPVSGGAGVQPRRMSTQVPSVRGADELGVEESEFDKPTYLRRGIFSPE